MRRSNFSACEEPHAQLSSCYQQPPTHHAYIRRNGSIVQCPKAGWYGSGEACTPCPKVRCARIHPIVLIKPWKGPNSELNEPCERLNAPTTIQFVSLAGRRLSRRLPHVARRRLLEPRRGSTAYSTPKAMIESSPLEYCWSARFMPLLSSATAAHGAGVCAGCEIGSTLQPASVGTLPRWSDHKPLQRVRNRVHRYRASPFHF
jgi:hypothetical protein